MANKYLLSSEPTTGNVIYYTANATGDLLSIGSVQDFTQGFTDTELALLNNADYSALENGALLIESEGTPVVDITPVDYGTVQTTSVTSIDLHGYSGINGINVTATGGKYAISFDGGLTWKSKVVASYEIASTVATPLMTSNTAPSGLVTATGTFSASAWGAFNNGSFTCNSNNYIAYTFPSSKLIKEIEIAHRPSYPQYTCETLKVEASVDGIAFNTIGYFQDLVWQSGVNKIFKLNNDSLYLTYRITISNSANDCGIGVIKMHEGIPTYAWQNILAANIATLGMTLAQINALVNADFAPVFERTQLDLLVYLSGAETLTSFVVSLPPNAGPNIINLTATPDAMHRETVTASCQIYDPEAEAVTYRVLFNGVEYQASTDLPANGGVSIVFPDNIFLFGSNAIKIEATDVRGVMTESTIFVTRSNTVPKSTSVLSGNVYRATVGDDDNDPVQYRILFNDIEKVAWSALTVSPATIVYEINKREINFGVVNTVRIEFKDEFGLGGFSEEQFVGSYYGLLFEDTSGAFYSNDLGDVINKLDFGTIIASQTSEAKEVFVSNKCGYDLSGLVLNVAAELPSKVYAQLSLSDAPFLPLTSIPLGSFMQNDKKKFYVRIATERSSYGGGDFSIEAKADPA